MDFSVKSENILPYLLKLLDVVPNGKQAYKPEISETWQSDYTCHQKIPSQILQCFINTRLKLLQTMKLIIRNGWFILV